MNHCFLLTLRAMLFPISSSGTTLARTSSPGPGSFCVTWTACIMLDLISCVFSVLDGFLRLAARFAAETWWCVLEWDQVQQLGSCTFFGHEFCLHSVACYSRSRHRCHAVTFLMCHSSPSGRGTSTPVAIPRSRPFGKAMLKLYLDLCCLMAPT